MGYYTDMVFKIYADGALYSLISGGRYDSLAAQFQVPRPACGFGLNMNLLYEVMAEEDLLEEMVPSCDLAVVYDEADRDLILTLMNWRQKGFSVLGVSRKNRIIPGDYRLIASYEKGAFVIGEERLSKEEMERKLGGL
jgi:ATP phosphoribosyltransferase regulatory subunit